MWFPLVHAFIAYHDQNVFGDLFLGIDSITHMYTLCVHTQTLKQITVLTKGPPLPAAAFFSSGLDNRSDVSPHELSLC